MRAARHPRRYPPLAALAALAPHGRGSLEAVGAMVSALTPEGEWSPHANLWIIAMDYDTGRRVAFGRAGAPRAPLSDAVMASCAIPGWFTPVSINGRRYVDGGTCSPTSLDLLAGRGLDEVYVLSPMTSFTAASFMTGGVPSRNVHSAFARPARQIPSATRRIRS